MLTPEDIRDIVRMLDSTHLDEFHVETGELSVTLRRGDGGWTAQTHLQRQPDLHRTDIDGAAEAAPVEPSPATRAGEEADDTAGLHRVTPPLPGTFYRAPRPGAPPFVDVGSTVGPDTVVGIVETMKMMNSVYAGTSGVVRRLCVANAEFAPAGTTLMLVEERP